MRRRNLYRIDDVLLRAGGLSLVALLAVAGAMAIFGLAQTPTHGREADFALLGGNAPLLMLGALCPVALCVSGFVLRRREKRIAAIWSLLEQNAEIAVPPLLANSDFTPEELGRAIRFLNSRGLGHYVWDRESSVIQDGRLRSLQILVEKCDVCSASVSIQVPIAFREIPRCPYCDDPVSVDDLQEQRRMAIAKLRDEHRIEKQRESWTAGSHAATRAAAARPPFSVPLFVLLLVLFWPAAVGYALYKWQPPRS